MNKKIRWAVLGCGNIARKFISDMPFVKDGVVVAVASRNIEKAKSFADEYSISKHYGSYADVATDPDIDAVYIATPHPMHLDYALMCIDAGKAVLCEKPLTINVKEAQIMTAEAKKKGVFLMEAMWTRFIPSTAKFIELIKQDAVGEIRSANIDFGFYIDAPNEHRIFNLDLGGGALLDVGVYVSSMASLIFGKQPQKIKSDAIFGSTGADINDSISFDYGDGRIASLQCSCSSFTPTEAIVSGEKGYIKLCSPFFCSETIEICNGNKKTTYNLPITGTGYCYEIQHVCECIKAGKIESNIMPLSETLEIMHTLDSIRKPWGLTYPNETAEF